MKDIKFVGVINFLKSLPRKTIKYPEELKEILANQLDNYKDSEIEDLLKQLQDYIAAMKEGNTSLNYSSQMIQSTSEAQLIWDNYDEAVDHFMKNVYRDTLLSVPKIHKEVYYQFARDYRRGELADARKNMILNQSNYHIEFTDSGIQITYPKDHKFQEKRG